MQPLTDERPLLGTRRGAHAAQILKDRQISLALYPELRYVRLQKGRCNMTLGLRKALIVSLVASIVLIANLLVVATWLDQVGVIETAQNIR